MCRAGISLSRGGIKGEINLLIELDERLIEVKEKQRKKVKWEEKLKKSREFYALEQKKADELSKQLEKEEKDVQKLKGISLTNLYYTFIGRKLERLDKEEQEALKAKLKYDEAVETMEDVEKELKEIEALWNSVRRADNEYKEVLKEKERLIHDHNSIWSEELYQLSDREAGLTADHKEYQEAITAGKSAVSALQEAVNSLDKAKGWATWDMIGGGMISTAIKHSHLDDAKRHVHFAQNRLRNFESELADIQQHFQIKFDIGNLLTFADYFFDGLIVDWVVRGRITDSLQQTIQTREQMSRLVIQLEQQMKTISKDLSHAKTKRLSLIEDAQ